MITGTANADCNPQDWLAVLGMNGVTKRRSVVATSCRDVVFDLSRSPFFRPKAKIEKWFREHGMVIVNREARFPWPETRPYNPKVIGVGHLNPDASVR